MDMENSVLSIMESLSKALKIAQHLNNILAQ